MTQCVRADLGAHQLAHNATFESSGLDGVQRAGDGGGGGGGVGGGAGGS